MLRSSFFKIKNRKISLKRTNNTKFVLISHVPAFYRVGGIKHTNRYEIKAIVDVFLELGFNVDLVDRHSEIRNFSKYDIIFGFGRPLEQVIRNNFKGKVIFYSTGNHPLVQNREVLKHAMEKFADRRFVPFDSLRLSNAERVLQYTLADSVVILGDSWALNQYKQFSLSISVYSINAFFIQTFHYEQVVNARFEHQIDRRGLVWMGSSGLVHKGLYEFLELAKILPEFDFYVLGKIGSEYNQLKQRLGGKTSKNVILKGFVQINSNEFFDVMVKCDVVYAPSYSEGGSPSVLNLVGNGGVIPVVRKTNTISELKPYYVDDLSIIQIKNLLIQILHSDEKELEKMRRYYGNRACNHFSFEKYRDNIREIIEIESD